MALFKALQKEIDAIPESEFVDPGIELGKNEKKVGTLSDELKRFQTYMMRHKKTLLRAKSEVEVLLVDHPTLAGKELEATPEHQAYVKAAISLDSLRDVFWHAVRRELDLWNAPNIGLRKGWEVVSMPPDSAPQMVAVIELGVDARDMTVAFADDSDEVVPKKTRLH